MIINKLEILFDFLLPRVCKGCETKLTLAEQYICSSCYSTFEIATESRIGSEFIRKFSKDRAITDFNSAFVFHDDSIIQKLIHSLKYEQNFQIGKFLGKKTGEILSNKIHGWQADFIIPVPLHHLRKAERGFNQSKEIAKSISQLLNIRLKENILSRDRFTKTQTKFSLEERKSNIEGAFKISNKKCIRGKVIILVDDVITTGATTKECAKVLIENGAAEVFALSVAIAA